MSASKITPTGRVASQQSDDALIPSFCNAGELDGIFNPRTVAIIGANEQPGTIGEETLSALMRSEFQGSFFMVGRDRGAESSGLMKPVYPNLNAIPTKVDLAVAVTPPGTAPAIVAECVAKEVTGVILLSSGFGANGADRAEAVRHMRTVLRGSRTRVIGPNALGVLNPLIGLNATPGLQMPLGGTVAFLSESATLGRFVLDWSLKHIVGFSAFACLGTMLDVSWANLIDYFGRDPSTRTIVMQISSIGDPRSLISAAREVSLDKPIIVIKTGRGDDAIRAVGWSSRCVLSDDDVLTAAFRRVGVVQVDTLEDLFYVADGLSKQPRPRGPRLMVVSNADGPGVLAADSVARAGVNVAAPAAETRSLIEDLLPCGDRLDDVRGDGSAESFVRALEVATQDPNCDGLLALMLPSTLSDPQRTAEMLLEVGNACNKPILITYMGSAETPAAQESLIRACFPTFSSPGAAARVFNYMWRYSYDLQALYETPCLHGEYAEFVPRRVKDVIDRARHGGRTSLTAAESSQIFAMYGIATQGEEVGEPQYPTAYIVKLGSRIDSQFGPVLMLGSADDAGRTYGDLAIGLPPLNATLARRMIQQSRFWTALSDDRNPTLLQALEAVLVRFSQLVLEQPWIKTIDTLLWISDEHVLASSSHCELHGPNVRECELPRPAIRPYPVQYISSFIMKNGRTVTIRPIRAEDEPLMVRFHERLSDESVYLRYFQRIKLSKRIAHERLARVCFLDYDRELALLAEDRDPQTEERKVIAVASLQKLPPRNEGEVAVLISDDHHGQGLGKELVARLVCFARDEGLKCVVASTMIENAGMCAIFKRLGFQLSTDFEEQLVYAKLTSG